MAFSVIWTGAHRRFRPGLGEFLTDCQIFHCWIYQHLSDAKPSRVKNDGLLTGLPITGSGRDFVDNRSRNCSTDGFAPATIWTIATVLAVCAGNWL
jgi:hypothetical protein